MTSCLSFCKGVSPKRKEFVPGWSIFFFFEGTLFCSPEQCSGRAIVLPPASALALVSASTNVKVFVKVFKTSLFPNLITDLIHL